MGWKGWQRIQFRTGTESTLAWTLTGTWALLSQKRVPIKKLPQDRPLNPPVPPPLHAPAPGLAPGPVCTTLNLPHSQDLARPSQPQMQPLEQLSLLYSTYPVAPALGLSLLPPAVPHFLIYSTTVDISPHRHRIFQPPRGPWTQYVTLSPFQRPFASGSASRLLLTAPSTYSPSLPGISPKMALALKHPFLMPSCPDPNFGR